VGYEIDSDSGSQVIAGLDLRGTGLRSLVERHRLSERLLAADTAAIVLTAPAGYGKSVLLAQWARLDPRPFASITLTDAHNDPAVLVAAVVEAFDSIEPLAPAVIDTIRTARPNLDLAVQRLEAAARDRVLPSVLILDELEQLESEPALRVLKALLRGTQGRSRLAMATRGVPPFHARRLQAEGRLTILGADDLVMTSGEARQLLVRAGLDATEGEVETIVAKTEGWPVALYLATLSRCDRSEDDLPEEGFGGDERNLVDYMRDELLATMPPGDVDFLTRIAFLDRLGGDLCDFVLRTDDAGERLAELARRNMLLIPLDRRDEWFRLHSLFADMLRAELHRRHGEEIGRLNLRASEWWESAGESDRAIGFAVAGADFTRAGRLIWESVPAYNTTGRQATIQRWIDRIGLERVAADPHLSLTMAHGFLADGDGGGAEYWAEIARPLIDSAAAGATDLPAGLALIDAGLARGGTEEMAVAAALASASFDHETPWISMADLMVGVAAHLRGDAEQARGALARAARRAAVWNVPLFQVMALGQLALLAAAEDDWQAARVTASQARAQIDRSGLIERPFVALPLAVSAYVSASEHRRDKAVADLAVARDLLSQVKDFGRWFEVETAAALAAAALESNDVTTAGELVAVARRASASFADAPMLASWIEEIEAGVGQLSVGGLADLTPAEVRVLRLLPGHLSYRQIADELIVSPNTVKTQIRSAYSKLGVSSRHDAVEACRGMISPHRGDSRR
jgi:LuxR family transcriptional regulator, maltose regulon positive regulatory protein